MELLLQMSAARLPDRRSRNLLIDFGPSAAAETVLLSAHIDSWDVGEGALDNGDGVFINYQAVKLLKELGLEPRRRVRLAFWTGEELGHVGGKQYVRQHAAEMDSLQMVIENDFGPFRPLGVNVDGSAGAACFVRHLTSMLGAANATGTGGRPALSEARHFAGRGVPAAALDVDQSRYFWYHHTQADTMDALDAHEMDLCVAAMAATTFVVADVPDRVPR